MKADGSNVKEKTTAVEAKKPETIVDLIQRMTPQIKLALPKHVTADRLARIAVTAIRQNPKLGQCTAISLLGGIMQSAQLGLEPNTPLGHAFLIPYWDSKNRVFEANFQVGYQGIIDLCYRSNIYQVIYAMEVYQNDQFDYRYGLDPYLQHKPANQPEGEPIYYYAVYKTSEGGSDFRVWSREKIIAHAKLYSQTFAKDFSPWKTNFDAMAKKTVLKDLLKYARRSVELQRAISIDGSINRANTESGEMIIEADYEIRGEDPPPMPGPNAAGKKETKKDGAKKTEAPKAAKPSAEKLDLF